MSFLQKRGQNTVEGRSTAAPLAGLLPTLVALTEYLTSERYPDGAPRLRSTLLVLVEDGMVKVCLSDRDQEQSLWRSASGLEDALQALEECLVGTHQDWRKASGGVRGGPGAKRKT